MIFVTTESGSAPSPKQRIVIEGGVGEIVDISQDEQRVVVRITGSQERHVLPASLIIESSVRPRVGAWFNCTFEQVTHEGRIAEENIRHLQLIHPDFLKTPGEAFPDLRQLRFKSHEPEE